MKTAFKIVRQFHLENGEPCRSLVISRRQSYHGAILGVLAATGMEKRRVKYVVRVKYEMNADKGIKKQIQNLAEDITKRQRQT